VERQASFAGDARRNGGATDRARAQLGWKPQVPLREGVARQLAWHRARRNT
jgi:nucleoside-diphosphate-sugar epimerase